MVALKRSKRLALNGQCDEWLYRPINKRGVTAVTKKTTVYITKYALSRGIIKCEGEITKFGGIYYETNSYAVSGDYRLTLEEAIEKAEDMRRRKLESMKKKMAFLESIDFKRPDPFSK